MANVFVVSKYILDNIEKTTALKLQKLVYYCQAWHLAWTENALFEDKIEAWRNGPVIPTLFATHKGLFKLEKGFFDKHAIDAETLTTEEKNIIDKVIKFYGKKDPHWLSQLTHMESPWKLAREKASSSDEDSSSEEITPQSMFEYYSSL